MKDIVKHSKEFGFYPKCDRKAKEGFSAEKYFIYSLKDHSGYWYRKNKLESSKSRAGREEIIKLLEKQ